MCVGAGLGAISLLLIAGVFEFAAVVRVGHAVGRKSKNRAAGRMAKPEASNLPS